MIIRVCIGSACHLKGSYEVVQKLKQLIENQDLSDKVELKSSFCLGQCSDAVSVKVDEGQVYGVSPDNVIQFFEEVVLGGL